MNRANLLTLAAYLDTLPPGYEQFDMTAFLCGDNPDKGQEYALHNGGPPCGTVACAVGHGPAAGFLFLESEFYEDCVWKDGGPVYFPRPNFIDYCDRVFCDSEFEASSFMFGSYWSRCDNTPRGAAARIRMACELGPDWFEENDWQYDPAVYEAYLAPAS